MSDNNRKDPGGMGNYRGNNNGGEYLLLLLLSLFAVAVVVYAITLS